MGMTLSSLSCDTYVHHFKEKLFNEQKFPHWFRYVDDIFILIPSNTDFSSCCLQLI